LYLGTTAATAPAFVADPMVRAFFPQPASGTPVAAAALLAPRRARKFRRLLAAPSGGCFTMRSARAMVAKPEKLSKGGRWDLFLLGRTN
jgi:hypothetical protein